MDENNSWCASWFVGISVDSPHLASIWTLPNGRLVAVPNRYDHLMNVFHVHPSNCAHSWDTNLTMNTKLKKKLNENQQLKSFVYFVHFHVFFLSSRSDFDRIKSENKSLKVIATRFRQLSLLVTCYLFVLRIRSYFHFQFIQRRRTPTAILTMRYRKGPK